MSFKFEQYTPKSYTGLSSKTTSLGAKYSGGSGTTPKAGGRWNPAINAAAGAAAGVSSNLLSGDFSTPAGSALTTLGSAAYAIPGPVGLIAGTVLSGAGVIANRGFGTVENKENIAEANNQIASASSYVADANDYDSYMQQINNTPLVSLGDMSDYYEDGWWTSNGANKYEDMGQRAITANQFVTRSNDNNLNNLQAQQAAMLRGNFSALGGQLNAHGVEINAPLDEVNEGGSHEENPYGGIQVGVDPNGVPNFIEEGETIYEGYVFSKRLKVSEDFRKKYKLGNNKDLTFADTSKKLSKEYNETQDAISKRGMEAALSDLAREQEDVRANQAWKKGINSIQPNQMESAFAYGGNIFSGEQWKGYGKGTPINREKKDINFFKMLYAKDSDYMKRRQYIIDNWENQDVKAWRKGYEQSVADYNKSRGYESPYSITLDDYIKGSMDGLNKDGTLNTAGGYGGMHRGTMQFVPEEQLKQVTNYDQEGLENPLLASYTQGYIDPVTNLSYVTAAPQAMTRADILGNQPSDIPILNADGSVPESLSSPSGASTGSTTNGSGANGSTTTTGNGTGELPTKDNWLRYMPVVGSAIGLAHGLFSKPDYSNADAVASYARQAGKYRPVAFNPIGDYVAYRPLDRQYGINQLNAQAGATQRNIFNTSGGNRGQAMAGLLSAGYNANMGIGNLLRQAEESNRAHRMQVAEFNRGTNQYNSQGFLQADMANQNAALQASARQAEGLYRAAAMREAINNNRSNAISANMTNLFTSLGNIGLDRINRYDRNWALKHIYNQKI